MKLTTRSTRSIWMAVVTLACVLPLTVPPCAAEADEGRYVSVTIRGRLTDPETESPMAGAVLRFISTAEDGRKVMGITDGEGRFEVMGLTYGSYVMEIETAEGEQIRGVNAVNVQDQPVEITLKISDRVKSSTSVDSRPDRFFVVVEKKGPKWNRFWREFAGFFGVAAGLGVAAL